MLKKTSLPAKPGGWFFCNRKRIKTQGRGLFFFRTIQVQAAVFITFFVYSEMIIVARKDGVQKDACECGDGECGEVVR